MPSDVSWLIENRVVSVLYYGVVTLDDVHGQSTAALALIEQGMPPVHIFVDASGIESIGFGISELRGLAVPTMPSVGWMMIIAPNALYRFFISIAVQFTRGSYKFVNSPQEALAFARDHDPTLPLH